MGDDPELIRERIEKTRGEMERTVAAISERVDVRARARNALSRRPGVLAAVAAGALIGWVLTRD